VAGGAPVGTVIRFLLFESAYPGCSLVGGALSAALNRRTSPDAILAAVLRLGRLIADRELDAARQDAGGAWSRPGAGTDELELVDRDIDARYCDRRPGRRLTLTHGRRTTVMNFAILTYRISYGHDVVDTLNADARVKPGAPRASAATRLACG